MIVMLYLTEGLVRGASDIGTSASLAWAEAGLASVAFLAILGYVRSARRIS
jgi:uncharacterized membrane protein